MGQFEFNDKNNKQAWFLIFFLFNKLMGRVQVHKV